MAEIVQVPCIINDAYFLDNCPIGRNFDCTDIRPYYHICEELWIVPIIGIPLYQELLQQVNDNDVTPENSTLLLKIYPLLSFAICYEALPALMYHFSEVGVTLGASEFSRSVNITDANYISKSLRSTIESMKKCLKQFLEEYKDLYPLYTPEDDCPCNGKDDIDPFVYEFFFNGGTMNRYDWNDYLYSKMLQKRKPNPYAQLYKPNKCRIDIN